MFRYILDLFQSLERFLGFENDDYDYNYVGGGYDDDGYSGYEYCESNKIVLSTPIIEQPIISPILLDTTLITSENTFVAKY
jgi:hypothetical protein